jgi:hypothetical protein
MTDGQKQDMVYPLLYHKLQFSSAEEVVDAADHMETCARSYKDPWQ